MAPNSIRMAALEQRNRRLEQQLRISRGLAGAAILTSLLLLPHLGTAQGRYVPPSGALDQRVANLEASVAALQKALASETASRQAGDVSQLASAKSYTDSQVRPLATILARSGSVRTVAT